MGSKRTPSARNLVDRLVVAYGYAWSVSAVCVAGLGLSLALLSTSLGVLFVIVVTLSCAAGVVAFAIADEYPHAIKPILISGPALAALLFVVEGLSRWLGVWCVSVVLALALTAPPVVDWVLGRLGRPRRSPTTASAAPTPVRRTGDPADGDLPSHLLGEEFSVSDSLDELDICRAWCSSFVALQRAHDVQSRLRSVQIRALYLDELERRDAMALLAWLESEPRPGSDPAKFFAQENERES